MLNLATNLLTVSRRRASGQLNAVQENTKEKKNYTKLQTAERM